MGVDKKYALLDTDFLYKSHLARNASNHTLTDYVMEFPDYEFFCHKMIKEELTRHEVVPDPNPWLEDKIQSERVKLYSDRDIVTELGKIYGTSATSMYLTLLQTSCDTFNAGFFEEYYGTMSTMVNLEDVELFLAELKKCDDSVPWLTAEKITSIFEDVDFVLTTSRHHLLPKEGKMARPKYHIYFPIAVCSDAGVYGAMKTALQRLVSSQLIEQYAMSVSRWIQCEQCISNFGFLAKHPTTGNAIASPYVAMSQQYMKQVNQIWYQIFQVVKENCSVEWQGQHRRMM